MVAYPLTENDVKRDTDLIRDLLIKVEENPEMDFTREFPCGSPELDIAGHSPDELAYHLKMLITEGYLKGNPAVPVVSGLTMAGHDFLGSIRDPGIWNKTKQRIDGLPGIALKIVAAIAEAELKRHLGLS